MGLKVTKIRGAISFLSPSLKKMVKGVTQWTIYVTFFEYLNGENEIVLLILATFHKDIVILQVILKKVIDCILYQSLSFCRSRSIKDFI